MSNLNAGANDDTNNGEGAAQHAPNLQDARTDDNDEVERLRQERWAAMAPLRKSKRLRTPFLDAPEPQPSAAAAALPQKPANSAREPEEPAAKASRTEQRQTPNGDALSRNEAQPQPQKRPDGDIAPLPPESGNTEPSPSIREPQANGGATRAPKRVVGSSSGAQSLLPPLVHRPFPGKLPNRKPSPGRDVKVPADKPSLGLERAQNAIAKPVTSHRMKSTAKEALKRDLTVGKKVPDERSVTTRDDTDASQGVPSADDAIPPNVEPKQANASENADKSEGETNTKRASKSSGTAENGNSERNHGKTSKNTAMAASKSDSNAGGKVSADAYERVTAVCDQEKIMWTKVKGHPFWPTQVVRLNAQLAREERFMTAARYRRKGENTCVMYFGTCEVAWINESKAAIPWGEGLKRNLHNALRLRPTYKRALEEVLGYCKNTTEYPRTWWNEPRCFAFANSFLDIVRTPARQPSANAPEAPLHADSASKPEVVCTAELLAVTRRAENERVCWARMRGWPYWPVQVLPLDVVAANYPELRLRAPPPGTNPTSWPCMFFGTGEVAMISDKSIKPFITGVRNYFWDKSSRTDFVVSLGEMWGYLQKPPVLPGGYLSGRLWWNHDTDDGSARVAESSPKMPSFTTIAKSVYAPGVRRPSPDPDAEDTVCKCTPCPDSDELCCVDERCINWNSQYLCDPKTCPAGARCGNRPFHMREGPKLSAFYTSDQRGWGLRLDSAVRKGQFVCEYVGELLDKAALDKRLAAKQESRETEYYIMDTNSDWYVDAEHKGGLARFINSSCKPNCESQKWTEPGTGETHVGIFALEDIRSGTEITYNYHENFGFGFDGQEVGQFVCRCRADTCCMLDPVEREYVGKFVGTRIKVRWDDGWYMGLVHSFSSERKKFRILYDDGDDEELYLGLPTAPKNNEKVAYKLLDDEDNEIK